jgi:hypothetical protein
VRCSAVPDEEPVAELRATSRGAAEGPTGRPAVGGGFTNRLSGLACRTQGAQASRQYSLKLSDAVFPTGTGRNSSPSQRLRTT